MALPNPLLQQLGKQLEIYRERAGIGPEQVDANRRLGWYAGKCERVERGIRGVTPAELHMLADQYKLTETELDALLELAERARKRARVSHVAEWARPIVLLEQAAQEFDYYDEALIPAVCQTPGYARDLLSRAKPDDLEDRLAARLERGGILTKPDAPRVRIVLGESALHRLPADADAAREQLEHLETVMHDVPSADLRILPWTYGLHPLLGFACNIFRLANPNITQVYLEVATTSNVITEPDEAMLYEGRFETLYDAADPSESARILRTRIQQLGTRRRHDKREMGSAEKVNSV
ncbi:transcriptional regulator [Lentzea sp. NBRC 105346]|uniref:helix-turn-helix domain-containing protein n=1 Tax=Lentzea sp. NBRC 105346 TaxID=3032205 RepID=UPI0024A214E2|nr:helix-turn-helix transcriptional regulator [Lentzea sp. NBRC 105346]GLZ34904.1 transcriptional regulator [Lentzea sp. NBRC 105346]